MDVLAKTFGAPLLTVPEDHGVESMRFNDGKGSPGGAFIVGRMHSSWRNGEPGRLYRSAICFNSFSSPVGAPDLPSLPQGHAQAISLLV